MVGGWFTSLGGQLRNYIGRLNADGSLDAAFNPGADERVFALALQPDGKVVVGGAFTTLGGQPRNRIGRLSSATAALQHLAIDPGGTTITWMRSGAGPEVEYVIFEAWIEGGSAFIPLGTGTRIDGGWRLSGLPLTLPRQHNLWIVARGYYDTGLCGGSASSVWSVRYAYLGYTTYLPLVLG